MSDKSTRLLPEREVAQRYGIVTRTLSRWDSDACLGFPRPIVIRNRRYRDEGQLDAFDAAQRAKVAGGRRP